MGVSMSGPWRSSTPDETGVMLRWVNWVARTFGFLWVGLLAFVFYPPAGGAALAVQTVGYSVAGGGLGAWVALEGVRRVTPYRRRLLPAVLGLIAAGAGAAAAAGSASAGGLVLVIYGLGAEIGTGAG